jgi:hypothetical protein
MRGSNTERKDNFERRLKETMGSELDPEMVTPNTAGSEELSESVFETDSEDSDATTSRRLNATLASRDTGIPRARAGC